MSAQLNSLPVPRPMACADLEAVEAIEREVYTHPWTRGNFTDSLAAGYHCRVLEQSGVIVAYAVTMIAAGEAHLLNLSVAAAMQRRGIGGGLLRHMIGLAREQSAQVMYLEVRLSNLAAQNLYARHGFAEIGRRRGYYPAHDGREDAVTMERRLA